MKRQLPRLTGRALVAARVAAESPGSAAPMREWVRRALGIHLLAELPAAWRAEIALELRPLQARPPRPRERGELPPPPGLPWPRSASAYAEAYRARATTPVRVAERALAAVEELAARTPCMNIAAAVLPEATLADARASAERHAAGTTLGGLDGVPLLVKDEFDVAGLSTTLGSRCEPVQPVAADATVVARLRRAGAVFLCKTVLTELGMSPIGQSCTARMPHNSHNPTRAAGGSSSGSGVGVALGLAPIATAGDGGGSIRIPAALNGIFGIKPTFGRVSRAGDGFRCSVAHGGPIGASTADLTLFLDVVASEPDPDDLLTAWAPPPPEGGFGALAGAGVRGLRIGVDDVAWADAAPAIGRAGGEALRALEREGATLVTVRMPIAEHAPKIGYCTIGPETLAEHADAWRTRRHLMGNDLRLLFGVLEGFTAVEQIDSQRLRTGLRREAAAVLREVDVLALPTTAITAPRCTEAEARAGFADPWALDRLCRHTFLGNLTGLPAATAPVGLDARGLPIGLQILGDAWDEAVVLGVLTHLERLGVAGVMRPAGAIDLLAG